jgi:DNA-binding IclR family transcriptional regulator
MSSKRDKLDEFISFLARADDWRSLTEVAEATQLSEDKVEAVARLFAEVEFAEFDKQLRRVKLGSALKDLYISLESDVKRGS